MAGWILEESNGSEEEIEHCKLLGLGKGAVRQRTDFDLEGLPNQLRPDIGRKEPACCPYGDLNLLERFEDRTVVLTAKEVGPHALRDYRIETLSRQDIRATIGAEVLLAFYSLTSTRDEKPVVVLLDEQALTHQPRPRLSQSFVHAAILGVVLHDATAEGGLEQVVQIQVVRIAGEVLEQEWGEFFWLKLQERISGWK